MKGGFNVLPNTNHSSETAAAPVFNLTGAADQPDERGESERTRNLPGGGLKHFGINVSKSSCAYSLKIMFRK